MHRQGRNHYRVSLARMEGVMMGITMTFEESIAKIDNIVQSYVSEIAMLRASNADLLAALKGLLRFNEELCADINVSKHYPSAEKARRAIAKAEIGEDAEANARLIVAAVNSHAELLAAAKRAAEAIDMNLHNRIPYGEEAVLLALQAAINKAESLAP